MKRQLQLAVLSSFRNDAAMDRESRFVRFTSTDWKRVYTWLDASGMALYFSQRARSIGEWEALPASVRYRLDQNLADNREQTKALLAEFAKITRAFADTRLPFAVIKGFSLIPEYCAVESLRTQFDLDFLVRRCDAASFANVLRTYGYSQVHEGDQNSEFKAGTDHLPSVRDLYRLKPQKSVELHYVSEDSAANLEVALLDRLQPRNVLGCEFLAPSKVDTFLLQAQHIFKHLCSEWTRVSWLLELRNFVSTERNNQPFWEDVRRQAAGRPELATAIGAATLLATMAFGEFAPEALTGWTVHSLPRSVRLWIECYGWSALLAEFPGTKLYLLLRRELMNDSADWRRYRRTKLLPLHRLPRVVHRPEFSIAKAFDQIRFAGVRLRFHVLEGVQYLHEAVRWNRRLRAWSLAAGERTQLDGKECTAIDL